MRNYICPQCNNEMYEFTHPYSQIFNEIRCKNKCIIYDIFTRTLIVDNKFLERGTFEECCRIFKLKVFS